MTIGSRRNATREDGARQGDDDLVGPAGLRRKGLLPEVAFALPAHLTPGQPLIGPAGLL